MSWLAAFWLCCQIAGFVAAPVVLGATAPAALDSEACDCPGTLPGQACPMHKGHEQSRDDETTCRLRDACDPSEALLSLSGSIAVLPVRSSIDVGLTPSPVGQLVLNPIARAELPDAPPPRVY